MWVKKQNLRSEEDCSDKVRIRSQLWVLRNQKMKGKRNSPVIYFEICLGFKTFMAQTTNLYNPREAFKKLDAATCLCLKNFRDIDGKRFAQSRLLQAFLDQ
jgi:hypothetical protein